ncbi:MAG: DUF4286 family protein [Chloroflexota bacterium]
MAEQNRVIHVRGLGCRPDQEEKLNKWYDEIHISDLMKFKGLRKATRYQLLYPEKTSLDSQNVKYPKYLAIYEFDSQQAFEAYEVSPELKEAMKEVHEDWGKDPYEGIWRVQYKLLNTRER